MCDGTPKRGTKFINAVNSAKLYSCLIRVLYLETIKKFLTEFYTEGDNGKVFTYGLQLTKIAHREQAELVINLDDVAQVS